MHINDVFAKNSKMVKNSFLLKHQIFLFNKRISKNITKKQRTFCYTMQFSSDPCAHGADHWVAFSLSLSVRLSTFLKPCEDLVKLVIVVNVVKT